MTREPTTRTFVYLTDYMDEVTPCEPTLDGWAEWLAAPDPDNGFRNEPARDGETFAAITKCVTWHWCRRIGDEIIAAPRLPDCVSYFAVAHGDGAGWFADDLFFDLDAAVAGDLIRDGGEAWVAAMARADGEYCVTFHAGPPPFCAIEAA